MARWCIKTGKKCTFNLTMSGKLWFVRPTFLETANLLTFARIIVKCTLIKQTQSSGFLSFFVWQHIIVTYTNTDVHLQFYKIIQNCSNHCNFYQQWPFQLKVHYVLTKMRSLHSTDNLIFLCGNRLQINSIAHVLKNKEVRPRKAFNLGDLDFTTVFFFFFALAGG